jgi:hypothetical protein
VVNHRKQRDSPGLQNTFELFHGLIHGMIAGFIDDSVICG